MQPYECFFEQFTANLLQLINKKREYHRMSKHRAQMFITMTEIMFELISLIF
jgi:hypothetical protein